MSDWGIKVIATEYISMVGWGFLFGVLFIQGIQRIALIANQ